MISYSDLKKLKIGDWVLARLLGHGIIVNISERRELGTRVSPYYISIFYLTSKRRKRYAITENNHLFGVYLTIPMDKISFHEEMENQK